MGHHPFCYRGLTIGSTVFGPNFLHSRNEPLSTFSTITVPVTLSLSPRRRGQLAGVVAPVFDPIKVRALAFDFHIVNCMLFFPSQLT
ncbi:hypothetical protein ACFX1T_039106 [Malus domestica]